MDSKFTEIIEQHEVLLKKNETIYNILGYSKLFLVIWVLFLVYFNITRGFPIPVVMLGISSFALLVFLWIIHIDTQNEIDYSNGIIDICKKSIARISGDWASFEDTGIEFANTEHAYSSDLDIVGAKSLFQFLNTTNTYHGRQKFANDLLSPTYERAEILERQEAISELSKSVEFSGEIQYHLAKIGADASASKLVDELSDDTPFMQNKVLKFFLLFTPALTLAFIVAMLAFQFEKLYPVGISIVVVQTIIWLIGARKAKNYLKPLSHLPYSLRNYSIAIDILCGQEFSSEKMQKIQEELNSASKAIRDLGRIADKVRTTQNSLLYFVFNALYLWDYDCAFSLEKWKTKHAELANGWFETLGEFESLLSFSNLPNACDNTCLPSIPEKKTNSIASIFNEREMIEVGAQKIGHPLLLNEARVNNELNFVNNIIIISGSNMSGKTTFLRTVGINLLLARSGSFVCAKAMICPPLDVITSMRITDDLSEGISTFYAELKRIKNILEHAKQNPNVFFLIDEIFRGTNSVDRLCGAKTVISKLNSLGSVGMISTHDLELCELEQKDKRIENFNFSEYYEGDTINFDYTLRAGKSKTSNAKYLMEMVGII